MSLAVPAAMLLTALALPIIAFYILKVRLRRVTVSTNLFWKQLFDEKPPRSIWQHFRHLLSLLVQLLLLLILVLAIADPYFSWQLLESRRIVLVLDNSASMRGADIRPSRFEAARKSAHHLVNGLRAHDQVAVVVVSGRPQVLVGMTGHAPTLHRAIDSIQVSDGPTVLDSAVELGRQLIGSHPHGQVIVLTDGCTDSFPAVEAVVGNTSNEKPDQDQTKPAGVRNQQASATPVVWQRFAAEAGNVGITQLQVRRSLMDPLGYEVLISVINASSSAVRCRLELTLQDLPVDVLPLTLQPGELWSRAIEKTSLEGGRLMAALTRIVPEGSSQLESGTSVNHLITDDTAWAILPARKVQDVLIVSPGNLFLNKVFEANPLINVQVQKQLPDQWPSDSIIVLHQIVPEVLPSGSVFVIDPVADCNHWTIGAVLENPIITEQDSSSLLMNHMRLDNVLMPEARQLQFSSPAKTLAGVLSGDAVYAEISRPDGRCLVLSINLERSDLAFRTAFPILVTNALSWFAGESGELREALSSGMLAEVSTEDWPKDSSKKFVLRSPADEVIPLSLSDSQLTIGPLNETGLWTISSADSSLLSRSAADRPSDSEQVLLEYAVNLANARESDLRPRTDLPFAEADAVSVARAGWFNRPIWFFLVAAACVITTVEWFLYQRRLIS